MMSGIRSLIALVFVWSSGCICGWAGTPSFVEVEATLFPLRHLSPLSPERHLHLFMGSGLGWADFDRDGDLDLLFCQGATIESMASRDTVPALRVWSGETNGFVDRSTLAALSGSAYAMGLTIGDFDNDGFADVFATGLYAAALYRNNGDGTFSNGTSAAGITPWGFGTGCCWADLNHDGLLDLIYVRYVVADRDRYPLCSVNYKGKAVAISCNPRKLAGEADSVYCNLGNGLFEDVTQKWGFSAVPSHQGLGCVALDLDDNGTTEVYVANDSSPNELWSRAAPDLWSETGLLAGVALNRLGVSEAGMGIAAGDMDGDLRPELFVTNYFNETNTLYRNEGNLSFLDVTQEFGVAGPSRNRLGFGVTLSDFDNDGWCDLLIANGHVQDQLAAIGIPSEPFAQLSQLLHNRQGRRFDETSVQAGSFFKQPGVARGTAAADVDGDGRVDVAVLRLNDRAALLRNITNDAGHWLAVELRGTTSNRDGVGATVIVRSAKQSWRRDRMASSSYLSCDSPILHFGLGGTKVVDSITVRWPSGRHEVFPSVPIDQRVLLVEGSGSAITP